MKVKKVQGNHPLRMRGRPVVVALATLALLAAACGGGDDPGATDGTGTATATDGGGTAAGEGPPSGSPADAMAAEPEAEITGDSIKIGLITVTEGSPFASNGQRTLEGAQFAVEQINAAGGVGGVPIELIVEDTRGSIEGVANLVRKLATEDNVLAINGPILSGECEVGCPVANELGVPVNAPGVGKPGVVEQAGPYIFHLVADDCEHTTDSLLPVLQERGIETAAIFTDEMDPVSAFMGSSCWPALFEEAGVEVIDAVTFTSGDTDFTAQITRLQGSDPQAVALAAGPADAARIAIEMQRQNFTPQLVGSGGLQSAGGDFLSAGGDAVNGVILAAQFDPDPANEEVGPLIESYEEGTGSDVTLNAAYAYDVMYMFVDVIKQMGVTNDPAELAADRDKIKDGLATLIVDWVGMGGSTTLEEDGGVIRAPQIAIVEEGEMRIQEVAGS